MFEKIVGGTDLSPAYDSLISCLQGLRPFGAREAVLVHGPGNQTAGSRRGVVRLGTQRSCPYRATAREP